MILSGAQSALAGVVFVVLGLSGKQHIKDVADTPSLEPSTFSSVEFCSRASSRRRNVIAD